MSEDGYLLDRLQPSAYEQMGHNKFVELSTAFYKRVYADTDDPFFRKQFDDRPIEVAIQNQYEVGKQGKKKKERKKLVLFKRD